MLDQSAQCTSDACRLQSAISIIREARNLDFCDKESIEQHFSKNEKELATLKSEVEPRFVGLQRLLGLRLTHFGSTQKLFKTCTLSLSPPDVRPGETSLPRPLVKIGDFIKNIDACPIQSQIPQSHGPSIAAYKWCGELQEKTLEVSFYFHDEILNSINIQKK